MSLSEKTRLYQEALERLRTVKEHIGWFGDNVYWLSKDEEDMLADARYEVDRSYALLLEEMT